MPAATFDAIGRSFHPPVFAEKIEQGPDAGGKRPALADINGMKHLRLTRIEVIEDRYEPTGGDILPHCEGGKANQPDTGKGKTAKAFAVADLHAPRRRNDDGFPGTPQRPSVD